MLPERNEVAIPEKNVQRPNPQSDLEEATLANTPLFSDTALGLVSCIS